jgi:hypothetical protein
MAFGQKQGSSPEAAFCPLFLSGCCFNAFENPVIESVQVTLVKHRRVEVIHHHFADPDFPGSAIMNLNQGCPFIIRGRNKYFIRRNKNRDGCIYIPIGLPWIFPEQFAVLRLSPRLTLFRIIAVIN